MFAVVCAEIQNNALIPAAAPDGALIYLMCGQTQKVTLEPCFQLVSSTVPTLPLGILLLMLSRGSFIFPLAICDQLHPPHHPFLPTLNLASPCPATLVLLLKNRCY